MKDSILLLIGLNAIILSGRYVLASDFDTSQDALTNLDSELDSLEMHVDADDSADDELSREKRGIHEDRDERIKNILRHIFCGKESEMEPAYREILQDKMALHWLELYEQYAMKFHHKSRLNSEDDIKPF